MWGAAAACAVLVVVGLVLLLRDDGDSGDASTGPDASVPATTIAESPATTDPTTDAPTSTEAAPESTSAPATTSAPTTLPPTTPPATTSPPTTLPPTTAPAPTAPLVPAGWSPAVMPAQAYPRLTEEDLSGSPSPLIVDPFAEVPDGLYATSYVAQDGATLTLDLFRFEWCEILGEGPCLPGPWASDAIGVSEFAEGTVDIPLDATTTVVLSGWDCDVVVGQGNGADLAAMYAALAEDYDAAFGAGLAAGADPFVLMESVHDNPVGRFEPPPAACDDGFSVQWRFDGAPPVLMQGPFDWETGGPVDPASLLIPSAIAVDGDGTTVYLYGGFFS